VEAVRHAPFSKGAMRTGELLAGGGAKPHNYVPRNPLGEQVPFRRIWYNLLHHIDNGVF
jgi:hypothetical protein